VRVTGSCAIDSATQTKNAGRNTISARYQPWKCGNECSTRGRPSASACARARPTTKPEAPRPARTTSTSGTPAQTMAASANSSTKTVIAAPVLVANCALPARVLIGALSVSEEEGAAGAAPSRAVDPRLRGR